MEIHTKNAVVIGFHKQSLIQAMRALEHKKIIDVKVWIGDAPECTYDIIDFYTGVFPKEVYSGVCQNIYEDVFSRSIYKFMDMMSRHSFYKERNFYDMLNIYNLFFDLFADMLLKHKIEIVLFSDLPHEGADLVLYEIAKKLNIETVLCHQSIFPNRFFYVYDVDDFGLFHGLEQGREKIHFNIITVDKEYTHLHTSKIKKKGIYYLYGNNSIWNMISAPFRLIFNKQNFTRADLFKKKYAKRSQNFSESDTGFRKYIMMIKFRIAFLFDLFYRVESFMGRQIQRYINFRTARKSLLSILTYDADMEKPFVYFPLNLQPELSTSGLGDIYADQLLAVERLSTVIPAGWLIYAKENPSQTELMRGEWFFKRLSMIKNVRILSPDCSTYTLINKCKFVANVTGTAGWEAITRGKNVLVFGNAWYKTLPGVFSYGTDFKLEDILTYKINADELDQEFNLLLNKTGKGIIDFEYSSFVDNYNDQDNVSNIAESFEYIIKNINKSQNKTL